MSAKTIVITFIVLALLGAAGGTWWLLHPASVPSSNQTTQTNSGSYYGGSNTSVATTPGSVGAQTQPVSLPDLGQAYTALFAKILAQKVPFTAVRSTTGDTGSVYALYAADIAADKKLYPALTDFPVDIALVDLNQDGIPEAIVSENLPGYCGSGGCSLDIYKKDKGKWVNIFSTVAGGTVGLSNVSTNGFLDLFLSVHGAVGYQTNVVRYVWNGSQYRNKEVMAAWDGQAFTVLQ